MKARKIAWIVTSVVLILAVVGIVWAAAGGTYEKRLTVQELQAKIDAKMPFTTKNGVVVSGVKLALTPGKIALDVQASGRKLGTDWEVAASTKGELVYPEAGGGKFYFHPDDVQIQSFKTGGGKASEKVGKFIDKWVSSPKIVENKGEIMQTVDKVVHDSVVKSAKFALANVAVYTFKDDYKGTVARLALEKFDVQQDVIVIKLSFWRLTMWVFTFIGIGILCIGFAVAMLLNPELLGPFALLGAFASWS